MAEDITIYRGTSYSETFICVNATGLPVDITNFVPSAEVRANGRKSPLILDLSPSLGSVPSNGEIEITLTPENTDVDLGVYTWDLLLSDGADELRIAGGDFTVIETTTTP
jgi:hypothetical protein